ncbi:hypothetical protein Daura_38880 [Dactylosporangium aurantiacum]|uniref:Uncharacterized protein n=1 Tax=Dactylosporangium aurantiacum TaxID=35754 RepID=A0A9Q9IHB0_9ACTN|nr:hypothetical protein [Dactylosporangium aurantiacum]MDG6101613.1 hypothetical protein [Dactylosporangium aurantiacum]UWZ52560.1 hypothetical protein Daura_38880 [Dactylosporangium aurantiacum]
MRRSVLIAAGLVLAVLGYGAYASTRPPDRHEFRTTAVQAAQSAHDALRTAYLAGVALRDGRATEPYVTVVLDDGTRRTTKTAAKLAELPPPDDDMRALRDELAPLLTEALQRLGDTAAHPVDVDALPPLADRLSDVLDRYA